LSAVVAEHVFDGTELNPGLSAGGDVGVLSELFDLFLA
jgi:hypothetical protein